MTTELPPSRVHFSFGSHGPASANNVPEIRQEVTHFFALNPDNKLVFIAEDAFAKESIVNRTKKFMRMGYSIVDATFLACAPSSVVKRGPQASINLARSELAKSGETPFGFALRDMLSELGRGVKFEFESENFPDFKAETMKRENEINSKKQDLACQTLFLQSDPEQGLDLYRQFILAYVEKLGFRNRWYIDRTTKYLSDASKTEKPVSVFIRIGGYHAVILDRIIRDNTWGEYNPKITHTITGRSKTLRYELLRDIELANGMNISDERLMQFIFEGVIEETLLEKGYSQEEAMIIATKMIRGKNVNEILSIASAFL